MAGILTLTVTMLDSRLALLKKAKADATASSKATEMETRMTGQLSSLDRSRLTEEIAALARVKAPLRMHGRTSVGKRARTSSPPSVGEGGGGAEATMGAADEEDVVKSTDGVGGGMWASAANAVAGVVGAAQGAFHAASHALL
jgi:hypothetical protein